MKHSFSHYFSIGVLALYVATALLYPVLPVQDCNLPSEEILAPPSRIHLLGTDDLGMDLFSQLLYGTRISLLIGLLCSTISTLLGTAAGVFAGYKKGRWDKFILSVIDIINTLPELPLMIVLSAFLGPGLRHIVFAITLISWTHPAKIIRSRVLQLRDKGWITQAALYGGSPRYIFKEHLFHELFPIAATSMLHVIHKSVIAEASLSFLGLANPLSKSWGMIINRALGFENLFLTPFWKWWIIPPIAAVSIFVIALSHLIREEEKCR